MARVHGDTGGRTVRRVLLAVVLSTLGLFVLPAIAMAGYCGRVLVRSSERRPGLPSFRDVPALLAQGVTTWLVTGAYVTGVFVLAVGVVLLNDVLGDTVTGFAAVRGVWDVVFGVTLAGLVAFPTWVFTPVALTRVARTDEVRAGFDVRTVLAVARRPAYLKRWARGVVFVLAGTAGYLYLSFEATLPWLVAHVAGTGLNCCCQLVAFREFGRGYAAATDGRTDPAADPEGERPMWGERPDEWRRRRSENVGWGEEA